MTNGYIQHRTPLGAAARLAKAASHKYSARAQLGLIAAAASGGTAPSNKIKLKKKKNKSKVSEMTGHIGGTISSFHLSRKAQKQSKKVMDNMQRPQYYMNNNAARVTGVIKQQGSGLITQLFTRADILQMQTSISTGIANATGGTGSITNRKNQFMFVDTVHGMTLITSASVYTQEMTIYDCMCRQDTGLSALQDWGQGLTDAALGTQSLFNTTPGAYPQQSQQFNKFWTVKKKTHVNLAGGAVHKHVFNIGVNRKIGFDVLDNSLYNLGGVTMVTFIVIHGYPVHNTGTAVTGLADSAVDTFSEWTYKYRYSAITNEYTYSNDSQGLITVAAETGVNQTGNSALTGEPLVS